MILAFWRLSFKLTFSLYIFFKGTLSSALNGLGWQLLTMIIFILDWETNELMLVFLLWVLWLLLKSNKVIRRRQCTPLQYSCLENPMDGGAWKAAVLGVVEGQTRLNDFTFTFHLHALEKEMATHSSVLAWRIPGTGEPCGLPSMGSHRVGHDWSDLAAAATRLFDQTRANQEMIIVLIYMCERVTG